ncbi:MAG TPA: TonB-dependent receptor [Candidatus Dormibacteraeota bacterium]|nr:TonB-dependent receptor [Candidatus Dormibacteraeota bacterium]
MNISLRSAFLSLAVLSGAIPLEAQTTSQNNSQLAHLSGTLTDSNRGGIGDVLVEAHREGSENSQTWSAKSSPTGEYSLGLPSGRYRVRFTRSSFAACEIVLHLIPGESHALNVRLALEPLSSNVVVTASTQPTELAHTPAPVDIVGSQEIQQRQAALLPDLLSTQTGISLARTGPIGGLTTIFIDGGNSSFTKVLIDGTPVNIPGGDFDFSNVTLDNVDKIEIVHGAESALYGTDAMSGVVQIVSHRGTTRVPEVNLFTEGGSFSSARGGAQVSGLLEHFGYSAAGSYFHTDGQGINDADLNRGFAGNLGYSFSDTNQVHLSVRSNSSFAGAPGQTLLFPPDPSAFYDLQQLASNLTWHFQTGKHWSHHFSGVESRYYSISGFPPFGNFPNQANRAGGLAQSTYSFRSGAVTGGYQYEAENVAAVHAHRNNQGGFLDGRWSPEPRLTLSAGGRADANASFGTRVVPRAGAVLALRYGKGFLGDTRVRIAYGQGIEEPTALESFDTDPCSPGNPNLRPQRSRTFNVGLDQYFDSDRVRVFATYFANEFRDLITSVPGKQAGCRFGSVAFLNTNRARARGVDFSATARLTHWLSLNVNYSHDDTRVLESSTAGTGFEEPGDHLLRRPGNSGNVWLNANYRRLNLNVNAYFTGVRTDSDFDGLGLTRNPGYARFDITTAYLFTHGVSFYGRVRNLLDKQYQETIGFPALGRDYRVGLNYRFSGRN